MSGVLVVIGSVMVAAVIVALFVSIAQVSGWRLAASVFGISFAATAIVVAGVFLAVYGATGSIS